MCRHTWKAESDEQTCKKTLEEGKTIINATVTNKHMRSQNAQHNLMLYGSNIKFH